MLLTQSCLFVVMIAYGQIDPSKQLNLVVFLSFLLILFSATQDIALDAFRREILMDAELGLGNAVAVTAYRFSMLVPGSFAWVLSDHLSWSYVFFITALFMYVNKPTVDCFMSQANTSYDTRSSNLARDLLDTMARILAAKRKAAVDLYAGFFYSI